MARVEISFSSLKVGRFGEGVGVITLDRPNRLNAISFEMFDELLSATELLESDDDIRVVVITGSGRGFCSGLDLSDAQSIPDMDIGQNIRGQEHWSKCVTSLHLMSKPVIAAINGPAAGAGLALALAADVRLAAPEARFSAAFVRIGLSGGDCGTSYFLPRIVGLGIAYELLLTGRVVDSEEAVRIGLVNRLVPGDRLLDESRSLAEQILVNSPLGIRLTKQLISMNVDAPSLGSALEVENRSQVLTGQSRDMREALAAFLEKRDAMFESR